MPLIHKLDTFYHDLYLLGRQLSKRDRFGIYAKIENTFLNLLEFIITAALEIKFNKLNLLNSARIKTEVLKRLFRTAYQLNIITDKKYLKFELDLQEISKMINGWIRYLK